MHFPGLTTALLPHIRPSERGPSASKGHGEPSSSASSTTAPSASPSAAGSLTPWLFALFIVCRFIMAVLNTEGGRTWLWQDSLCVAIMVRSRARIEAAIEHLRTDGASFLREQLGACITRLRQQPATVVVL